MAKQKSKAEWQAAKAEPVATDAMVRAYKEAYLKHCEDALNGRIPRRAEDFTFEASRKGIAAALAASPSPVDSRDGLEAARMAHRETLDLLHIRNEKLNAAEQRIERLEDAVRIYLEALDSDPEKDVLDEDGVSFASDWSHQKHDAEVAAALDDVRAALAAKEQQP